MKRLASISLSIWFLLSLVFPHAYVTARAGQDNRTATQRSMDQQKQGQAKDRRGTIRGRVVADGGQPLAHVGVNVFSAGATNANRRSAGTDEEGKFEVDDLPPGAYSVNAYVAGYVAAPVNPNERRTYRIGETVTLTMIKGGVITGQVKSATGDSLVGVPVRALRVKDSDGKPTRTQGYARDRQTDDRGIYRLYGLEPGTYVVFAGGTTNFYSGYNKFGEDVPTYYPSATRDTAVEVIVQAGQEAVGIDINYRGEKGHAISGAVTGAAAPSMNTGLSVTLLNAATGTMELTPTINYNDRRSFTFYGVPDGDYYLVAETFDYSNQKEAGASHLRRVTVKGADVTGLELPLTPMASIGGRILMEAATGADVKAKCEGKREASVEETGLTFLRETRGDLTTPGWLRGTVQAGVDDKGAFTAYRLYADRYRLDVNLPSDNWYLKTVSMGEATKGATPLSRNASASEVVTKGLALKAGDRVENLTVTIGEGAAAMSGKVVAATETEKLPTKLRVYLVPTEKERADDVLRYAQTESQGDGAFSFANLAPGKYWLLTREVPQEEATEVAPRPSYWEAKDRAAMRKEAEAANAVVELRHCQQLKEHRLRHAAKPVAK